METFDSDLHDYLNAPDELTEDEKESLACDLWQLSGCCNAPIDWPESDTCHDCKEHSSPSCDGCYLFNICINPDKVII